MKKTDKDIASPLAGKTTEQIVDTRRELAIAANEREADAHALAQQLGYEGGLTADTLEDGIRFFQQRTAEGCLEMGKRLLLLKEVTPHGEFSARVAALGFEKSMAARFMQAALRFAKVGSNQLLKAANSQTKLLALVVLDDEEIAKLDSGESVRGIDLDDVDRMAVSDLRKALRKANQQLESTERLLDGKNAKIDKLAMEAERVKVEPADERIAALRKDLAGAGFEIEALLLNKFLPILQEINDHERANGGDSAGPMLAAVRQVERTMASVRAECGMPALEDDGLARV